MADYYGVARTNYFRVNSKKKFREFAKKRFCNVIERDGRVGLIPSDESTFPSYDPETDADVVFIEELAKHIKKGEVAVVVESGHEKLRYVVGHAQAVDHTGRVITIQLSDIYEKARRAFNAEVSVAEY